MAGGLVQEDYVEYFLFPELKQEPDQNENQELFLKINEISKSLTQNYIWHKGSFNITEKSKECVQLDEAYFGTSSNLQVSRYFYGMTHYGDNIEDEWFIVYLLIHLSKKIKGLVVRVIDSDGEFLLIEAANFLPDWVNPSKCDGKVFIYEGMVHIVTQEAVTLENAMNDLRDNPSKYSISAEAFGPIHDRIKKFSNSISDILHRATIYVPTGVAVLLNKNPQLISPATLAFCNCDSLDSKVLKAMKYFPPENRIYTSVTFTKYLYAMLMHNNFNLNCQTGWNIPSNKSSEYKAHLLGAKIACGFEILAYQQKNTSDVLLNDKQWLSFVKALSKRGYFKEKIEGSKEYILLLEEARNYYLSNQSLLENKKGRDIVEMLKEIDADINTLKQQPLIEDSDDWLNISSDDLDRIFEKRYGQNTKIKNLELLSPTLEDFLKQESDIDGVQTENVLNNRQIDIDASEIQNHIHTLLDLVIPEDSWESSSEMSDYEDENNVQDNYQKLSSGKTDFNEYIKQMDQELQKTTLSTSFEKQSPKEDEFADIENFNPVDIDVNTVKNMVESYKSQMGGPGPAGNLLGVLGIKLDDKELQ